MTFPRGVLLFSACAFGFFGAWAFVSPASQLTLVEVGVPSATAAADTRAQYGGFTLGMAVFLFVCLTRPAWTSAGLAASACTLTGFVLARAVSVAVEVPVQPVIYYLAVMEGSGAVLSFVGWRASAK
ncbi:MAG: DUF4345 family protein [Planctomycetes bacterium]|nr:DUF4345 family protein [Planctomycetota bacterium]